MNKRLRIRQNEEARQFTPQVVAERDILGRFVLPVKRSNAAIERNLRLALDELRRRGPRSVYGY